MDGILLLDLKGTLLLKSGFQSSSSSQYPLSIVDSLVHILKIQGSVPPVVDLSLVLRNTWFPSNKTQADEEEDDEDDKDEDLVASSEADSKGGHEQDAGGAAWPTCQVSQAEGVQEPLSSSNATQHPPHAGLEGIDATNLSDFHVSRHTGPVCCNVFRQNLWFAAIIGSNLEPTIVFEYLYRLIDLLETIYQIPLDPIQICNRADLVYQILQLCSPSIGCPFGRNLFEPGLIGELLSPIQQSAILNLLTQAADTISKSRSYSKPRPTIFSSPIPWRASGLEYVKQEVFLDTIETVSIISDRDGNIVRSELIGVVEVQSKLSGMPDLLLSFDDDHVLADDQVGFHQCVRNSRWKSSRKVSFIPPDGRFKLMSFRMSDLDPKVLPVTIKSDVTVGEQGGSFKLEILKSDDLFHLHPASPISFKFFWFLGRFCTGCLSDQVVFRSKDTGQKINHIDWEYNDFEKVMTWTISSDDLNCHLLGLWSHASKINRPSPTISVEFQSKSGSFSISKLRVHKLDVNSTSSNTTLAGPTNRQDRHQSVSAAAATMLNRASSNSHIRKGVRSKVVSGKYEFRWC